VIHNDLASAIPSPIKGKRKAEKAGELRPNERFGQKSGPSSAFSENNHFGMRPSCKKARSITKMAQMATEIRNEGQESSK
jgi:hypothetical protein